MAIGINTGILLLIFNMDTSIYLVSTLLLYVYTYLSNVLLRISKSESHVNLDLLIVDPLPKQIFVFDTLFEGLSALALGPVATHGFVPVLS